MKKNISIIVCLILAILVNLLFFNNKFTTLIKSESNDEAQILSQNIINYNAEPKNIYKIYNSGKLVGVINSIDYINSKLEEVYNQQYKEKYPDKKIYIGQDMYITDELSYFDFENIDDKIFEYINEKQAFSLETTAIEFSNDSGVYAVIYVNDKKIFDEALDKYLEFFVDKDSLKLLKNKQTNNSNITGYGSKVNSIQIANNITNKLAYVNPSEIKTTVEEVLEYLKYGDNKERNYYTVKKYDTVEGVGAKNFGLSAEQVMNINSDIIKSTEQILEVGTELNVTYFTSPIDVIVNKESVKQEVVYAGSALLIEDPSLREGISEKVQDEENGSKNVLYEEKWINGVLVSGTEISSVVTKQPVQEIIKVGTLQIPGIGSGVFRWPVDNPYISCRWLCYYNHRAIDVQNEYNRYDVIYAADRGVIEEVSYNGIGGNYVVINHNNGYKTYYGHMREPSHLTVGTVVDKGDVIGKIGRTGLASGPHVHFFITENDERRNPCEGFLGC